jgi:hypothetical protein
LWIGLDRVLLATGVVGMAGVVAAGRAAGGVATVEEVDLVDAVEAVVGDETASCHVGIWRVLNFTV